MPPTYTHHFDTPLYKGSVTVNTGLFINGEFVDSVSKETIDVINPVDGEVFTKVAVANHEDMDIAVKAAREAYKKHWGLKVSGYDRGRLLSKLADIIERNVDEISAIEALDCGKHFFHAKMFDLVWGIKMLRYFAGWADKNHGQTVEADNAKFAYTRNEPIGVCGLITPWNFPVLSILAKLSAAIACGNTVICKPSEVTPMGALKLAEYTIEAGFPPGVINIVQGYGAVAGQALIEHRGVGKISFTGSTVVGRRVMEASARSNLKRITLELGGKSPAIIFDDANMEKALLFTSMGIFHHSGQMCAAGSRIFVQEGIYDRFVQAFAGAAKSIQLGGGFEAETQQGPLVSKAQLQRVLGYIESGKKDGATLLTGGSQKGQGGYFVEPTIFTDVRPDMKIVKEEIFGPVAVVIKFKTEEEVIEMANDTEYGLCALVFSENISRAMRVANSIEAGQLFVNTSLGNPVQLPFGGFKQSGFGKELGSYALEAFTAVKAVCVGID